MNFSKKNNFIINEIFTHKSIHSIKIILLICCFLNLVFFFFIYGNLGRKINFLCSSNNSCKKWIVIISFNSPSLSIINLEKNLINWKIVVIGANRLNDKKWKRFKFSNKLFYLTIKDQLKLNYRINKYLDSNSYFRKSIGYLFAIQYGAKEIYELDENLEIGDHKDLNLNLNNSIVCYGKKNDNLMINPFAYFGKKHIWPRGFKINDLGKSINNEFGLINSSKIQLSPLVYQGLINGCPDIDSIYLVTRIKHKESQFSRNYPLIYTPGNYVPINSKNTRYLYEIFPLLIFFISLEESIADIWRGYIIQYFAWKYKGCVVYYYSEIFQKKCTYEKINFIQEKKNYFELNELLLLLNSNSDINDPLDILKILVSKNILTKKDIEIYKEFLNDLIYIGYDFSSINKEEIGKVLKDCIKTDSELKLYLPSPIHLSNNGNIKILEHCYSKKIYNDILLIINYNKAEYINLNKYMKKLYNKYFPNIIFVYPSSEYMGENIISCNESFHGFYSYKCFSNIYNKYPFYQGYLFINDDLFLKPWELENLDFKIPWFFELNHPTKDWCKHFHCDKMYEILSKNFEWKENIIKFFGTFTIQTTLSDFYYLPNDYIHKFCEIIEIMYNSKIFLEIAVPTTHIILSSKKYQIVYYEGLWGEDRKNAINNLYKHYKEISIHPIKFSNYDLQVKVNNYIYFTNAIYY